MNTCTLATKDLNHTNAVSHRIDAFILRTDAAIQTTDLFGDNRQSTANDCI